MRLNAKSSKYTHTHNLNADNGSNEEEEEEENKVAATKYSVSLYTCCLWRCVRHFIVHVIQYIDMQYKFLAFVHFVHFLRVMKCILHIITIFFSIDVLPARTPSYCVY